MIALWSGSPSPLSAQTLPLPTAVRPPLTSGLQHLRPTFRSLLRPSTSTHEEIPFHQSPCLSLPCFIVSSSSLLPTVSLLQKLVQYTGN